MAMNCKTAGQKAKAMGQTLGAVLHDFDAQCVRILLCTAHALANSPGGLKFKAGTRPWLSELTVSGVRP